MNIEKENNAFPYWVIGENGVPLGVEILSPKTVKLQPEKYKRIPNKYWFHYVWHDGHRKGGFCSTIEEAIAHRDKLVRNGEAVELIGLD